MDDARLYGHLVAGRIRSQLQYPWGFVSDAFGTMLLAALDLAAVLVLFSNVPTMAGWSALEVCVLFGVAQTAFAIADLLVGHLDRLPTELRAGTFDTVLVQPRSSLLMMIASDFSIRRLGQVVLSLGVLVVAWQRLGLAVGLGTLALLAVTLIAGTAIFCAIWVIGAATTFWTVDTMELTNSLTYGGRQLTSYPIGIYGAWLRRFVLFVVPLGCVAYFPVRHLVGREPDGAPAVVRLAGVPAALALAVVAGVVWRAAVRTYRGTGS